MQKVIISPDSYKGILSAKEVCDTISYQINKAYPFCEIIKVPVADGGEGSLDAFMSCKDGRKIFANAFNAAMQLTKCYFLIFEDTAVIETSQLISPKAVPNANVLEASTYGIGQLILQAIKLNVNKIILCLGDSIAADCGCGMAAALGAKFFDGGYNEFLPKGSTLADVAAVDFSIVRKNIRMASFRALINDDSSLIKGVSAKLMSQGVDSQNANTVHQFFERFNTFLLSLTGTDHSEIVGGGAALGLGAGAKAFLDANLSRSIESILELVNFGELIRDADVIITGEGSLDANSLEGNVLTGVTKYAKRQNIPVLSVVGKVGNIDREKLRQLGVTAIFSLNNDINVPDPKRETILSLSALMGEIMSIWQIKSNFSIRGKIF